MFWGMKGGLTLPSSMAAAKPQGQALRVLACSQPCPFPQPRSTSRWRRRRGALPPAGLRLKRLLGFNIHVTVSINLLPGLDAPLGKCIAILHHLDTQLGRIA